jgi:hypothetical protein
MAEHAIERARFTELRARALTEVLLSGREDLSVHSLGEADYGIDHLVTLHSERPGLRQFAVQLRATYSSVSAKTANILLSSVLKSFTRYGPFPYPIVLFYFTMMDSQGWYTWVFKPVGGENGTMTLQMQQEADCQPLDEKALDQIIACANRWYDFSFGTKPEKKGKRPAHPLKNSARPGESEVVITDLDTVTFDYSEALLQAREELDAARQCSSYIIKTYPTPLPSLTGVWDRKAEEKSRVVITLKIMDVSTKRSATARFTPQDLQCPAHVYQRFHQLLCGLKP